MDKIIAFEKGDLLFIFNFHPTQSFENYRIGTVWNEDHIILMETDESEYGGYDRLRQGHSLYFEAVQEPWNNRPNYIHLYIPSRTAIVMISKSNATKYGFELP